LESISFADGVTWSIATLRSMILSQAATSGSDTIIGFNTADTLYGGAGDDIA
jgi:Ca2+-binding RTX toxin-like protein